MASRRTALMGGVSGAYVVIGLFLETLMLGLPAAEQQGDVYPPIFITGLEVDGVGFMKEVGVEHHGPVGAIGHCHRLGVLPFQKGADIVIGGIVRSEEHTS